LIERRLEATVFREIKKIDKTLVKGAGIGNDYSEISGMVTADGTGDTPTIAWVKANNNYVCSMSKPVGARVIITLPEDTKESYVKSCMKELQLLAERDGIQIVGGHTQVVESVSKPLFTVNLFGHSEGWHGDKKAICDGSSIIMCGYAGMLGTDMLIQKNAELISERFGNYFSDGFVFGNSEYSVSASAQVVRELRAGEQGPDKPSVAYIHDISCGGVYAALWQLGKYLDCGFVVNNDSIAIKQETIEICEALDKNPYLIDGTGALLIVSNDAEVVLQALQENGIVTKMIGRINKNGERCVAFGEDEMRTLAASVGDEIY